MDIKTPIKNETLIVALGTALCYTGAYAYARGFCLFFGIPTELITVTPASIIYTVFLFAAFLMTLYMASSFPVLIASKKNLKNKHITSILTLSPIWIIFNLIFFLNAGFELVTFLIITVASLFLSVSQWVLQNPWNKTKPTTSKRPLLFFQESIMHLHLFFGFLFYSLQLRAEWELL